MSTRGEAPILDFAEVLLAGLARDGGLYVPEAIPVLSAEVLADLPGRPYAEVASRVVAPFLGGGVGSDDLLRIAREAYAGFDHPATAPLVQLEPGLWLMELTHGPTLAFKDYALQVVGRLFDLVLRRRGQRITIVGATSGDTGSAAIDAVCGLEAVDIFILYPHGRVSEVQRRLMTTVDAPNVHCIAVEGSFDDCQDMVKAMFADERMRDELALSAVNSINWARVALQTAYYAAAAAALGGPGRRVSFAVPSGNFGNVYAGFIARRMGIGIERLVIGTNRNDILARYFSTGVLAMEGVAPTLSPSMDIEVSSNFERLVFDLMGRDGPAVAEAMRRFRTERRLDLGPVRLEEARTCFAAHRLDDEGTLAEIRRIHGQTGLVVDPHTAVGVAAARACPGAREIPVVALSTAHPAKFPDAVERAIGLRPALPPRLADLGEREERVAVLPADLDIIKSFVRGHAALGKAA